LKLCDGRVWQSMQSMVRICNLLKSPSLKPSALKMVLSPLRDYWTHGIACRFSSEWPYVIWTPGPM